MIAEPETVPAYATFSRRVQAMLYGSTCILGIVSLAACADPNGIPPRAMHIVNATGDSVGITALSEEFSAVIDPLIVPTPLSAFVGIVVPPRSVRELPTSRVSGWRDGGNIFVQTWRISGGIARYQEQRFFTATQIRRQRGQFVVTSPNAAPSGRVTPPTTE